MAITTALCTSFKEELLGGTHVFGTDTFKLALYTSSATLSAATTAYATTNEVTGAGYTAGGVTLASVAINASGTTAYVDVGDVSISDATITARGCLIYNSSKSNKAVATYDFGADKTSTAGTFAITIPAVGDTALIALK